jgi:hypothetical protein
MAGPKSHLNCRYSIVSKDGVAPVDEFTKGDYVCGCLNDQMIKGGAYPVEKITVKCEGDSSKITAAVLDRFRLENEYSMIPSAVNMKVLGLTKMCHICFEHKEKFDPLEHAGSTKFTDGTPDR